MKLNVKAFALSAGIVWGLIVFLSTMMMLLRGYPGGIVSHLGGIYIGYSISFVGSIIGLIWGFISMYVVAWLFCYLYNRMTGSATGK
jgi:hypothetical protein